jgi:peptidoglycan/xylan/chitin deacetylase (PgdA/CDA1 family)
MGAGVATAFALFCCTLALPMPPPSTRAAAPSATTGATARLPQLASGLLAEPARPGKVPQQPGSRDVDCRTVKCVALTFDDGPVGNTAKVLDVLRSRGARATFFVLGVQARKRPGLLRRMVAEGSTVGNHSWSHPILLGRTAKAIRAQFARTEKVITAAIGPHHVLVRTPFGQQNKRIRAVVRHLGSPVILWNVDPRDWKDRKTKTVIKRVVKATRRNSIVLLHDVWPTSRAAVATIIDKLQAKGYVLVTVPELIGSHPRPGAVYSHR